MRQVLIVAARPPSRLALQRALSRFMKVGIQTDLLLLNLPTANVDGLGLGDVHRTSRRYRRSDGPPASRWSRRWFEVIARNLFFSRIGPRLGRTADAWLTTRGDPWVDRKASASEALVALDKDAIYTVWRLARRHDTRVAVVGMEAAIQRVTTQPTATNRSEIAGAETDTRSSPRW